MTQKEDNSWLVRKLRQWLIGEKPKPQPKTIEVWEVWDRTKGFPTIEQIEKHLEMVKKDGEAYRYTAEELGKQLIKKNNGEY